MFDKFNQTLSFAADPPEGGGGTKINIGGSGFANDSTAIDPPALPVDPPESGGGTESDSTQDASAAAQ